MTKPEPSWPGSRLAVAALHLKTAPGPGADESWAIADFGRLLDLIQPSCQVGYSLTFVNLNNKSQ
eukprot:3209637-Rhodomonas_salina.1